MERSSSWAESALETSPRSMTIALPTSSPRTAKVARTAIMRRSSSTSFRGQLIAPIPAMFSTLLGIRALTQRALPSNRPNMVDVLKQSWRWRRTCLERNRRLRTAKRRCGTSSLTRGPTFRTSSRKIKPPGRISRWMTSPST